MQSDNGSNDARLGLVINEPSTTDLVALCDWAEIQSLVSPRGNTSTGDIMKYSRPDDVLQDDISGAPREAEKDEAIAQDVLGLAFHRQNILQDLYPFRVTTRAVELKSSKKIKPEHEMYLFCLMLSTLISEEITSHARHMFEIESQHILHDFFGGEAYHFGWTIENANRGKIEKRLKDFCGISGLKLTPKDSEFLPRSGNDIGIDSVIWKQVADDRENCVLVFGQCASGANWPTKLASQAHQLFCDCFVHRPSGPHILAFLTPFYINSKIWRETTITAAGIVFDRLRFSLESHQGDGSSRGRLYDAKSRAWLEERIEKLRSSAETIGTRRSSRARQRNRNRKAS